MPRVQAAAKKFVDLDHMQWVPSATANKFGTSGEIRPGTVWTPDGKPEN